MDLPDKVDMEIEESDIQQNLITILNAMNSVRSEQISEKEVSYKRKDEYLHLAYRLASCIEGLADENITEKIGKIADSLKKNEALMNYDYLQDGFWRKTEPEFSETLDQILINQQKDNFSNLEEKYHILQAIKYLHSTEKELEERLDIYDTILPFTDNSSEYNKSLFKKQIEKIGVKRIEEVEGLTLKIKDSKNLEEILQIAGKIGFSNLQVFMNTQEYEERWKEKYPKSKIITPNYIEKETQEKKQKWARYWRGFITATWPFAAYVIGGLPDSLVQKIENYFIKNDQRSLAREDNRRWQPLIVGSTMMECFAGMGLVIFGVGTHNGPLALTGFYLFASFIHRAIRNEKRAKQQNFYDTPRGEPSLHSLLWSLPFWIHYKHKNELPHVRTAGSIIEFELKPPMTITHSNTKTHNFQLLLEELGEKKVSEDGEKNLIWSLENHHGLGKEFAQEILEGKKTALQSFKKEEYADRKNQAWIFYDTIEPGPYKKVSLLTCFKDLRYAMTYITKSEKTDFKKLNEELLKKDLTRKGLEKLSTILDANYLHISKFEKGTKTDDYTLTK